MSERAIQSGIASGIYSTLSRVADLVVVIIYTIVVVNIGTSDI